MGINTETRPVAKRRQPRVVGASADASPPVWPGLEGGDYQPLSAEDMVSIHNTVLDLLENTGLSQAIPSMIKLVCDRGGALTSDGRLLFPRELVDDVIANCRRDFVLYGRAPGRDLKVSGARVHVGTGGASPNMIDLESGL